MKAVRAKLENPLADLISDDVFELICAYKFTNQKLIRDYLIRKQFKELRAQNIRAFKAMSAIQNDYKELKFDTIRKIVYGDGLRETLDSYDECSIQPQV